MSAERERLKGLLQPHELFDAERPDEHLSSTLQPTIARMIGTAGGPSGDYTFYCRGRVCKLEVEGPPEQLERAFQSVRIGLGDQIERQIQFAGTPLGPNRLGQRAIRVRYFFVVRTQG